METISGVQINPEEVKTQLGYINLETKVIAGFFKSINEQYLKGTEKEWNTTTAEKYINGLTALLNDFVKQYNPKFEAALKDFVKGVNTLCATQEISGVPEPEFTAIEELDKGWTSPSTGPYNIPFDFTSFTETTLNPKVEEINTSVSNMERYINVAVKNGLGDSFCTNIRSGIQSLKKTAEEVLNSYGKEAAAAAVASDNTI